jgi:drug/metabolite transporter (DMT)-like permease
VITQSKKAELYLLLTTLFWGLTFPLISISVKQISPITFVFIRFFIAAALLLPLVYKDLKYTNYKTLGFSALLGVLNFLSYSAQSVGLKTISSGTSAFITSTNVAFVPLLALLFRVDKPKPIDFICSFVCLIGLYEVTGANLHAVSSGEIYTIVCALLFAGAIVGVSASTNRVEKYNLIAFYQIAFTALFALPFAFPFNIANMKSAGIITSVLFCAIFATATALYIQAKFQKFTTASKAALIFCLEPLLATFFGWLINHEQITARILIGGGIIITSIALPDILRIIYGKKNTYAS